MSRKASPPSNQTIEQFNNAVKLHKSGQSTKALTIIQRLLTKNPHFADAHYLAAGILVTSFDLERAQYHAQRALDADPSRAEFHALMGSVHASRKDYAESIPHYQRALERAPDLADALNGLALGYKETGKFAQAAELFDQLLIAHPENQEAIVNRALLDLNAGRAHDAIVLLDQASQRFPKNPVLHDLLALASSYDDQLTPEQAFGYHQRFGLVMSKHLRPRATHPNAIDPARKLRIGYISADFHQHSIAYFLAPILEHHNQDQFEIYLYSTNAFKDDMTQRLRAASDHWRLFSGNQLRETIDAIAKDRIDILIELTGHFASNSLPVLAAKPAPVQITYLGYANTTGLSTIDYRIIDAVTDPKPTADALNTETLLRLDGCFLTYDPLPNAPAIENPDPDRPFTFASFNDLKKLTPSTVRAWVAILKSTPGSQLIIKNAQLDHDELKDSITNQFTDLGIDRTRIHTIGRIESTTEHLALYNSIDLALDTFPYTGTTTTCEALSMGVPVLTLVGNTHAARVSTSLLRTVGLDDLCAPSTEDYIRIAIEHANAGKRPAAAREKLRQQITDSPLCDASAFVPRLEDAYRQAWTNWCHTHGAKP